MEKFEGKDVAHQEKLKIAVHYTVGKMCEFREQQRHMKVSSYVEAALASLVYRQAEFLAKDLELFARHARRSTIQVEDVKLCARRNPEFMTILEDEIDQSFKSKNKS